jgi:hypothetical protein
MKVEIGTETPLFLFWEYFFSIFVILSLQCIQSNWRISDGCTKKMLICCADTAKKLANCDSEMSPRICGFVICGLIIKVCMPSFEYVAGRAMLKFYITICCMGARNRVGIGLSYWPARHHGSACITTNRFLFGSCPP